MSSVTHMNESYHTHEWVMPHPWLGHVTHMICNQSHEYVPLTWICYSTHTPLTWICHTTHMNLSCHTHPCMKPKKITRFFTCMSLLSQIQRKRKKKAHSILHIHKCMKPQKNRTILYVHVKHASNTTKHKKGKNSRNSPRLSNASNTTPVFFVGRGQRVSTRTHTHTRILSFSLPL